MPAEFSPFGALGNIAAYAIVAIGIPIGFAFIWPCGVSRRVAFFLATIILGAVLAGIAIFWQLAPLATVGTSGGPISAEAAESSAQFASFLVKRFYIGLCALAVAQVAVSAITRRLLFR